MNPVRVKIPVGEIHDWETFHTVFAKSMGFPDFYGRNMNAWIDCMTHVDEPEDGMTTVHASKEGGLLLELGDCTELAQRCPEIYQATLDCTGFVNYRRVELGEGPVLSLSFIKAQL